jgi:RsiW-degrading membrane proteinase PrsW (M82 family)
MSEDRTDSDVRAERAIIVCVSGPDAGKRLALNGTPRSIGRAKSNSVASDDIDLAERHVIFAMAQGSPSFEMCGDGDAYLDGAPVRRGRLRPGEQLRLGRSVWSLADEETSSRVASWLGRFGSGLGSAAGLAAADGFSARELFADIFTRKGEHAAEEIFSVGSVATTPSLNDMKGSWPRPWFFARAAILSTAMFFLMWWAYSSWENIHLVPGLILVGSFAIPVSVLVFFFEMNTPRNVSIYQVFKLFLIGGVLSLILTHVIADITAKLVTGVSEAWAPVMAAPIEEIAKFLVLLVVVTRTRYRWTLNGLLFGATIGCGFAAFESAGYALRFGLASVDQMHEVILLRGVLTLAGLHIAWTAIAGAALWKRKGQQPFSASMLVDPRVLRVLAISIALHAAWNAPFFMGTATQLFIKAGVLGFIAWALVIAFVGDGLRQIRRAQDALRAPGRALALSVVLPAGGNAESAGQSVTERNVRSKHDDW